MKARLSSVICAALLLFSGCVSKDGGNKKIASEYEQFKNSLPPAVWQPTGVRRLDDIGILSAKLYLETYNLMKEYISATENNRYYIGLMEEVDRIKRQEKLDEAQALQKAFNNIAEADKNRAADQEPNLPRVIEGYNAVQALQPANKVLVLANMLPQIADLIVDAKRIPDEIKHELASNPFKATMAVKSANNVLQQLYYTQKMVQYIKMQYDRNQEMKKYMQD